MGPKIIVVGGGIAGLSVAWHLAPHARVTVLEQGAAPAGEAAAQNAGMVRRLGEDPVERALAMRMVAFLERGHADWPEPPSRKVGAVLGLVHDPLHLHGGVAHLRARGVRVEAHPDPVRVAPVLAGAKVQAAWWLPDEHMVDPARLCAGYLAGLARMGVEVRCGVAVDGLQVQNGRCVGVQGETADAVVVAAGAWSAALARACGLHRPLVPLRRACWSSPHHPLATPDHPWVWLDDVGVYARPEDHRWLVSPCDEAVDWPAAGPGSLGTPTPAQHALLRQKLRDHLPALAELELEEGWTGLRTFAPDRAPVLGPDGELPGLWWAAGLGGFGVSTAHGVGEVVAAWLLEGTPPEDVLVDRVRPERAQFGRWPIRPEGRLDRARLVDAGARG